MESKHRQQISQKSFKSGITAALMLGVACLTGTAVAATNPSGNTLQVYVRGTDNCLYHNYLNQTNLAWDYWLGWSKVNVPCNVYSAPAAAHISTTSGRQIHVAYRNTSDRVIDARYDGTTWNALDMGINSFDNPGLVNVQDGQYGGHLGLFIRGTTDFALWERTLGAYDGKDNWGSWALKIPYPNMSSGPSVTTYKSNNQTHLQMFYQRQDNHVVQYYSTLTNSNGETLDSPVWSGPYDQGGVTYSEPTTVSWGAGGFYVFVRGTDNDLWVKTYWPSTGWGGWSKLLNTGGTMASAPSAVVRKNRNGTPQLHVFWRKSDNTVDHTWYESSWNRDNLGGGTYSGPAAMYYP